jgi:hypothetical protein
VSPTTLSTSPSLADSKSTLHVTAWCLLLEIAQKLLFYAVTCRTKIEGVWWVPFWRWRPHFEARDLMDMLMGADDVMRRVTRPSDHGRSGYSSFEDDWGAWTSSLWVWWWL